MNAQGTLPTDDEPSIADITVRVTRMRDQRYHTHVRILWGEGFSMPDFNEIVGVVMMALGAEFDKASGPELFARLRVPK